MFRTINRIAALLASALLCASFLAHAQAPTASGEGMDKERRQQMREHMKAAYAACKDKSDLRSCMREQMCAKAADPAKCQAESTARAHRRLDERQAAHEACTGKRGDELAQCLGAQHRQRYREHYK